MVSSSCLLYYFIRKGRPWWTEQKITIVVIWWSCWKDGATRWREGGSCHRDRSNNGYYSKFIRFCWIAFSIHTDTIPLLSYTILFLSYSFNLDPVLCLLVSSSKCMYVSMTVQCQSGGAWRKESVYYYCLTQRGGDRTDYLCSDLHRLRKGADHRLVEGAVSSIGNFSLQDSSPSAVPTWLASGLEVLSGDGYWKFEKLWQALMYGLIGSFHCPCFLKSIAIVITFVVYYIDIIVEFTWFGENKNDWEYVPSSIGSCMFPSTISNFERCCCTCSVFIFIQNYDVHFVV